MEKPASEAYIQPSEGEIVRFEGQDSHEINLAAAERLIERLNAVGTLSAHDKAEAEEMIEQLEAQQDLFIKEDLPVPPALLFAIGELTILVGGGFNTVGEVYAHKESEPIPPEVVMARAAELELELTEQQAAGTLWGEREKEMRKRVESILPLLEAVAVSAGSDTQAVVRSQKANLESFLRLK